MWATYRPAIQFWRPLVAVACGAAAAAAFYVLVIASPPMTWDFAVVTFLLGALAGLVARGWPGPVAVVAGDLLGVFALGADGLEWLVAIILGVLLVHGYATAWVVLRWRRSGAARFFADVPAMVVTLIVVVALPVVYWVVELGFFEGWIGR